MLGGFIALPLVARAAQDDAAKAMPASPSEPFSFADFTWLNGENRQKTTLLETKYFTGEAQLDTNYVYDFNRPQDHTIVGSTVTGRSQEIQVLMGSVGGTFHYNNVHATITTQFGNSSTLVPRNDPSPSRGQYQLADGYKYIAEMNGGYHLDVMHGLNIDAGIFMSYIGLFSYLNYENWAYQPSYVSDNTPFFFNGLRVQLYPTDRLKVELWVINGWQSYGMFNEMPGIGYQVLYRPTGNLSLVTNGYYGDETAGSPGRSRIHSDSSIQYKYYDAPAAAIDKAAFSITADLGCEEGDGVKCIGSSSSSPNQSFTGIMAYNRLWFNHDQEAVTIGGGYVNNPGRYLVLPPPIQGATATNNSAFFPQTPGTAFHAWDTTVGYDWMPNEQITYRIEYNHRQADVAYFSGPRGITAPGGYSTTTTPPDWQPDLVKREDRINLAMMIRF